jgi:hypothetical protein
MKEAYDELVKSAGQKSREKLEKDAAKRKKAFKAISFAVGGIVLLTTVSVAYYALFGGAQLPSFDIIPVTAETDDPDNLRGDDEQIEQDEINIPVWIIVGENADGTWTVVGPGNNRYVGTMCENRIITVVDNNNETVYLNEHGRVLKDGSGGGGTVALGATTDEPSGTFEPEYVTDDDGVTSFITGSGTGTATTTARGTGSGTEGTSASEPAPKPAFVSITLNGNDAEADAERSAVRIRERRDDNDNPIDNTVEVRIREAGDYVISGTLNDGQIVIDVEEGGVVNITLRNVNITCSDGPALRTARVNDNETLMLIITSEAGTVNSLVDARPAKPNQDDPDAPEEDDTMAARNAAVFVRRRAFPTFTGTGQLNITGGFQHGINSRENLTIVGGAKINVIRAPAHGTRSRLATVIDSSEVTINAGRRGIRSAGNTHGHTMIYDSNIKITSIRDGIYADVSVTIQNSTVEITTNGGHVNRGDNSARGIRAGSDITLIGGTFSLNCGHDGVNSSSNVTISGVGMSVATNRRALRANVALDISNSNINVPICTTGLQGDRISINGGTVSVHAIRAAINVPHEHGFTATPDSFSSTVCNGCH